MKLRVLLLFVLLHAVIPAAAQQWFHNTVPYFRTLNSAVILEANSIVFAGGNQKNDSIESIYRTDDRCASWGYFTDTLSSWLKSIAFADTANGFGVGPNGNMAYTHDGGRSWAEGSSPLYRDFNKVVYTNAHTLLVAGGWLMNGNNRADSMQTILKSTDGGNSWTAVYDQPGPWLESLVFIDTLKGFAIGDSGTILATTNGGSTWQPVAAPIQRSFISAAFINPDTGFIVGGFNDATGLTEVRTILTTVNAGATWTVVLDQPGGCLHDISFADDHTGYIAGDSTTVLKTTNSGQTWSFNLLPTTDNTQHLNVVKFSGPGLGVVGGAMGNVYVYTTLLQPQVYSLYSALVDSADVTVNGMVDTRGGGGSVYFIYSTDSNFANLTPTYPLSITNDTLQQFNVVLNGLIADTTYYWCAVETGLTGTFYGDTLRFYTGINPNGLSTKAPGSITTNSAVINGQVSGFTVPISLNFEYGHTPALGNTIAATPPVVSDALLHQVSANLSGLTPHSLYCYRLTGTVGGSRDDGDIFTFFTGSIFSELHTLQPVLVNETMVNLYGKISGAQLPVTLSFDYSAGDYSFDNNMPVFPSSVTDSFTHYPYASITGLTPLTTYYCRLRAETAAGVFYGDTVPFYTDSVYNLNVLTPHGISQNTCTFYGTANVGGIPSNLFFQYGIDSAYDHEVAATPGQSTDSTPVQISASVTGLTPGGHYYYRVKAVDAYGSFYSAPRSFYAINNEIPNWSFENWDDINQIFPGTWWIFGNIARTPSYNGTTAMYLYGNAQSGMGAAFTGLTISGLFIGGSPFTARPDSMMFYANYNVATGDTAWAFFGLKKNGTPICYNAFPITGNSGNNWVRMSYLIGYQQSGAPDTILSGFCSSQLNNTPNRLSWLKVDDVSFAGTTQNIPDADFETWDSTLYQTAMGWTSSLKETPLTQSIVSPITRSTDAVLGNYAANIHNTLHSAFMDLPISGYITTQYQGNLAPSFTVTKRYNTFNFYCKFSQVNNDTAVIYVDVFSDTTLIGTTNIYIDTPVNNYTQFTGQITYFDSTSIPNGATLRISSYSSNPQGASALLVDNLGFDGFYADTLNTGLPVIALEGGTASLKLYPNPTNGMLAADYTSPNTGEVTLTVYDLSGRVLLTQQGLAIANLKSTFRLDLSAFNSAVYLVHVKSEASGVTSRIMLVR